MLNPGTRRHPAWRLVPLAGAALLAGCAINPDVKLSEAGGAEPAAVTLDVPFFPQTENQCGPAALATVLAESGVRVTPEQLSPQVYLPAREGSLQVELAAAARRAGRIPYPLAPRLESLLAELGRDQPVLLLQNLGTPGYPVWHYAVLTGYDVPRNLFLLNSGVEQGLEVSAPKLVRTWDWGGRWALVTLRPGELPAFDGDEGGTGAERFARAVADFEAVAGGAAALPSWRAAAERWPNRAEPALALGNQAYRHGRLAEAAGWYEQGLDRQPGSPALANNLASVLGEAGCARRGEEVLRPVAAQLGSDSAWSAAISATLAELAGQTGADADSCARFAAAPPR